MNYLKYCDFFDVKFHFYIGGHPTNNSIFGGIMNILFILSCFFSFLIFSFDDIRRLNPITSKSEIPGAEMRIVNLRNSKVWIPWRMVTYEEKFVDHRGILHPIVSLIKGEWNNSYGMNLTYKTLNYKLCNETSMANKTDEYKIDVPLDELFCIEDDDIPWGGSWYGDILYYVEVNLFLCKEGIHFNASDPRCTKMSDLLEHRNTSWLFEFYYPVVQFQPTNFDVPMAVIYRSYYYRLSTYANKVERIYVQENILSDDTSLINSKSRNSSYWGVINNIYGDSYFMPEGIDPLVKSTSSRLYSLVIYMDQGYIYYTRCYKKVFAILSDIFPILNFLLLVFKRFTRIVKLTFAKKSTAELLFENPQYTGIGSPKRHFFKNEYTKKERDNEVKTITIKKQSNFRDTKNILNNNNNFLHFSGDELKYDLEINNSKNNNTAEKRPSFIEINNNENSKSKTNLKDINLLGFLNKSQLERVKKHKISGNIHDFSMELKDDISKKYKVLKQRNNSYLFPLYYFFMDIFIDKLIKPKTLWCVDKRYLTVYNFMGQVFDVSSHIYLFKHYNLTKNLFLTEFSVGKDLYQINMNNKMNINDETLMADLNKELEGDENCYLFNKRILI